MKGKAKDLNSDSKTKAEMITWRRDKIIELKAQGLDQMEIAKVLQVSPATICSDIQCMRREAMENVKNYTTRELPLQYRVAVRATWNAIKEYWNISPVSRAFLIVLLFCAISDGTLPGSQNSI